jgi:hypothetical protein
MRQTLDKIKLPSKGHIRIYAEGDPSNLFYSEENVITNTVKGLFARMMANIVPLDVAVPYKLGHDALYGVWGLALGAGDPSWAPETQPIEMPTQQALITPFLRKNLSGVNYVDSNLNPITQYSNMVNFQTTINSTTDNITQAIREMGLIGGGSAQANNGAGTNMLTAPYWNPAAPVADSVILVNYKTLPPLLLPVGINLIFSWILSF